MMKKRHGLRLGFFAIFLVVFNIVFFVSTGMNHPLSVWIAYIFIHAAYLMIALTQILTRKTSSAAVFGFSIYTISTTYFIIELIVGVVFIILRQETYQLSLIIQIVLAGIYAFMLLSVLLANEHTSDSIARHEAEVYFIKDASSRISLLASSVNEKQNGKLIEKIYDLLHSSPSKSNSSVRGIETSIMSKIEELETAVMRANNEQIINISADICQLVNERNIKLRINQ